MGIVFLFVLDFNLNYAGMTQLQGEGGGWAQAVALLCLRKLLQARVVWISESPEKVPTVLDLDLVDP